MGGIWGTHFQFIELQQGFLSCSVWVGGRVIAPGCNTPPPPPPGNWLTDLIRQMSEPHNSIIYYQYFLFNIIVHKFRGAYLLFILNFSTHSLLHLFPLIPISLPMGGWEGKKIFTPEKVSKSKLNKKVCHRYSMYIE